MDGSYVETLGSDVAVDLDSWSNVMSSGINLAQWKTELQNLIKQNARKSEFMVKGTNK